MTVPAKHILLWVVLSVTIWLGFVYVYFAGCESDNLAPHREEALLTPIPVESLAWSEQQQRRPVEADKAVAPLSAVEDASVPVAAKPASVLPWPQRLQAILDGWAEKDGTYNECRLVGGEYGCWRNIPETATDAQIEAFHDGIKPILVQYAYDVEQISRPLEAKAEDPNASAAVADLWRVKHRKLTDMFKAIWPGVLVDK